MRFQIPHTLLAQLRAVQSARGYSDDVTVSEDAFLLDPGFGPASYLTADGRVLLDTREWSGEPVREATPDEAVCVIVVGAKKTGIAGLFELLPPRPFGAATCDRCLGNRFWSFGTDAGTGRAKTIVCPTCAGHGWVD
ncbi:hypothetical protein PX52LOC_01082 [Limnoglobus roseus]|uniref:Uncharacterized protein n=1 Tax=Limnoglobus roseus TaxID=2598579 RepID=A0A5C1A8V0_9BACT|nr:hypothetical protein PX52LOC_01082 [Limnoglobus roseus]